MNWDKYKAINWLLKVGMGHIRDGLTAEGGELIYAAKFGNDCDTRYMFKKLMKRVCWWDDDMIEESISEFLSSK